MADIWICINAYQEHHLLPDCIKSARNCFPDCKIVVVDGSYDVFVKGAKIEAAEAISARNGILADSYLRFTSAASNDGTLEICREQKVDALIEVEKDSDGCPKPWENEYIKRSKYFVGKPGDLYFVLDADERIITGHPLTQIDIEKEMNGFDHGCVKLQRDDQVRPYPILRIHKHFDGMKYEGAHHALWVNGELIKRDDYEEKACIQSIYLDHRWAERAESDRVRHMTKGSYYRKLLESEGQFRTKHKI